MKQRINITVNKDTGWAIKQLAKIHQVPVATKAAQLLEDALELEEDLFLAKIADTRSKKGAQYIPFEEAWKNIK